MKRFLIIIPFIMMLSLSGYAKGSSRKILVTATVYQPVRGQCDKNPLITADGSKISLKHLKRGKLKWIALSRDLLREFKYGTRVSVHCKEDPSINGIYTVHDTMNKRWKRRIDILSTKKTGKWKVYIKKV